MFVGLLSATQSQLQAGRSFEPSMAPHPAIETVAGELLVRYRLPTMPIEIGQGGDLSLLAQRQQALTTEASRLSQTIPVAVAASFPLVGMQRLTVTGRASVPEVIAQLAADQAVEFVEPNYKVHAFESPRLRSLANIDLSTVANDAQPSASFSARKNPRCIPANTPPVFPGLRPCVWPHLLRLVTNGNVGQAPVEPNDLAWPTLWAMQQIHTPQAWQQTTGSREVIVAVIDTGVDYTHRDLAPNMWHNAKELPNGKDDDGNGIVDDVHGARFCGGDAGGDPRDGQGHGTHVAGTIAAVGNNRHDVAGVAWSVRIMALKFLCEDGSGSTADAIRAIEYALVTGAHLINASWGGRARSRALEEAVREADRRGVLFVAAAGNEGMNNDVVPSFPASYSFPNVLAVAATDWDDALADFSNFGIRSVHLAAPGVSILSTMPDNRLAFMNGTSMATPHVTGCAVLMKSSNPALQARDLKQRLLGSGDSIKGLKGVVQDGLRMNCGTAVQKARPD
jgi:subtilisin family serine protease